MHCRKDFMDLTSDERTWLAAALNGLYDRGTIAALASEHDTYFYDGIHFGPAFLPWHRFALLRIENELRSIDARVTLPYWDWTRADSRDLDAEPWKSFFGGRDNNGGQFDHWSYTRGSAPGGTLPDINDVVDSLRAESFSAFGGLETTNIHVGGHLWTDGTMSQRDSPGDPLFYLHHNNIDRLWAIWQLNNPDVDQYDDAGGPANGPTFVPLNDPMVGGATPASMLDHKALGYRYPVDAPLAAAAEAGDLADFVSGDPVEIDLLTAQVLFNDVPEGETVKRAMLFGVGACENITFEVIAAPTGPFSLYEPSPFVYPQGAFPTDELRIWLMYTGTTDGAVDAGTISVRAVGEDGDVVEQWDDVPLFANTVRRPSVGVSLVLDESGSMLSDAGNNRDTRLEVLRTAAGTLVDQLYDDNGVFLVSFATSASKLTDLQVAGTLGSSVRSQAKNEIAAHGPPDGNPTTSIGAGLEVSAEEYDTSPVASDFDIRSTVVFTDGYENTSPMIADVDHLVDERVYAVGVGDADNVRNETLREIADNSGGYMLVTGAVTQDDEFLLEKFFLQILAGINNRDIVTDPGGLLIPGHTVSVPFDITRSDIAFDAIGLTRYTKYVVAGLRLPDGTVIDASKVPAGTYRVGPSSLNYRTTLPLVVDKTGHWEGRWELLMQLRRFGGRRTDDVGDQWAMPYHVLVNTYSNLRMRARLAKQGAAPGSTLFLRAALTEYGQPLETHPAVRAIMTTPDRSVSTVTFRETDPGRYETTLTATQSGAYRFRVLAQGVSSRGYPFTRESLLTAVIGERPVPGGGGGSGDGGDCERKLCELVRCLVQNEFLGDELVQRLKRSGINIEVLLKCLERYCRDDCGERFRAAIGRQPGK